MLYTPTSPTFFETLEPSHDAPRIGSPSGPPGPPTAFGSPSGAPGPPTGSPRSPGGPPAPPTPYVGAAVGVPMNWPHGCWKLWETCRHNRTTESDGARERELVRLQHIAIIL